MAQDEHGYFLHRVEGLDEVLGELRNLRIEIELFREQLQAMQPRGDA